LPRVAGCTLSGSTRVPLGPHRRVHLLCFDLTVGAEHPCHLGVHFLLLCAGALLWADVCSGDAGVAGGYLRGSLLLANPHSRLHLRGYSLEPGLQVLPRTMPEHQQPVHQRCCLLQPAACVRLPPGEPIPPPACLHSACFGCISGCARSVPQYTSLQGHS